MLLTVLSQYDKTARAKQTSPPSTPVAELWSNGVFPVGEVHSYRDHNLARETSTEARDRDRVLSEEWNMIREAAECHRQVRKWAQVMMNFWLLIGRC